MEPQVELLRRLVRKNSAALGELKRRVKVGAVPFVIRGAEFNLGHVGTVIALEESAQDADEYRHPEASGVCLSYNCRAAFLTCFICVFISSSLFCAPSNFFVYHSSCFLSLFGVLARPTP